MAGTALTVVPQEAASVAETLPVAGTSHPLLAHAYKAGTLQADRAARGIEDARATVEVFASGVDAADWQELLQIQDAAWRRLRTLQDGWLKGWAAWIDYAGKIRGANTLSKLVEREGNIGVQFAQLLSGQLTDLVGLQENVEVDYSYWINEKLMQKRANPPAR